MRQKRVSNQDSLNSSRLARFLPKFELKTILILVAVVAWTIAAARWDTTWDYGWEYGLPFGLRTARGWLSLVLIGLHLVRLSSQHTKFDRSMVGAREFESKVVAWRRPLMVTYATVFAVLLVLQGLDFYSSLHGHWHPSESPAWEEFRQRHYLIRALEDDLNRLWAMLMVGLLLSETAKKERHTGLLSHFVGALGSAASLLLLSIFLFVICIEYLWLVSVGTRGIQHAGAFNIVPMVELFTGLWNIVSSCLAALACLAFARASFTLLPIHRIYSRLSILLACTVLLNWSGACAVFHFNKLYPFFLTGLIDPVQWIRDPDIQRFWQEDLLIILAAVLCLYLWRRLIRLRNQQVDGGFVVEKHTAHSKIRQPLAIFLFAYSFLACFNHFVSFSLGDPVFENYIEWRFDYAEEFVEVLCAAAVDIALLLASVFALWRGSSAWRIDVEKLTGPHHRLNGYVMSIWRLQEWIWIPILLMLLVYCGLYYNGCLPF